LRPDPAMPPTATPLPAAFPSLCPRSTFFVPVLVWPDARHTSWSKRAADGGKSLILAFSRWFTGLAFWVLALLGTLGYPCLAGPTRLAGSLLREYAGITRVLGGTHQGSGPVPPPPGAGGWKRRVRRGLRDPAQPSSLMALFTPTLSPKRGRGGPSRPAPPRYADQREPISSARSRACAP